ncbi:MAG TPA: ABC transporter permease [Actinomycetes bacterium]|nr:ABC transporter permease [Actinomycetes bacterium]
MTTETAEPVTRSPRAIAWSRRRTSTARFLRNFASYRTGMFGVGILVFFVLVALTAPLIFPVRLLNPNLNLDNESLCHPSWDFYYWLGCDDLGRSVMAELAWGARPSLIVGITASIIAMVIGTLVGIASGHFRGLFGGSMERLTDWFLVLPFVPLVIVLQAVLGQTSIWVTVLVLGITSWPGTARLVRAQTLSVEARPYIERAKVLGNSDWAQMTHHVLPNVMPLVIANTTLTVAIVVLSMTTLAFLGLFDDSIPTSAFEVGGISWGGMLDAADGSGAALLGAWWFLIPPGLCVIAVVLAFTLIGRTLEIVLNPRLGSD